MISSLNSLRPRALDAARRRPVAVNSRAFLPAVVPLRWVEPPFDRILAAAIELPERYHRSESSVRPWLDGLFGAADVALLHACDRLSEAETHALLSALGVLCHAYRWEHAPPRPEAYQAASVQLPAGLGRPWARLSARAGIPRVGTAFHMVVNNWRQPDLVPGASYVPRDLREDALELQFGWLREPESRDLASFIKCSILTEAQGVGAIEACFAVAAAAAAGAVEPVISGLDVLEAEIERISGPFRRLIQHRHVRPEAFMRLIQPTFIWGIDEGDGVPEGAAGPQLGVFQAIDALLGTRRASFLGQAALASRAYMLPRQRRLLDALDTAAAGVRAFIAECRDAAARCSFNRCVAAMARWRSLHRARAVQYVTNGDADLYASSGGAVKQPHEQRGRILDRLLGERIEETRAAAVPLEGTAVSTPRRAALIPS